MIWGGRRNPFYRREFSRHHRSGPVAHQGEYRDQHRQRGDHRQRDGTGSARIGAHQIHPAPTGRRVRKPTRQQRIRVVIGIPVRVWVRLVGFGDIPVVLGVGFRVGTQPAVQPLGGEFGSHVSTVGAATATPAARTGVTTSACG